MRILFGAEVLTLALGVAVLLFHFLLLRLGAQITSKMFNGTLVASAPPYMAAIMVKLGRPNRIPFVIFCAGTLIDSSSILTSGNCTQDIKKNINEPNITYEVWMAPLNVRFFTGQKIPLAESNLHTHPDFKDKPFPVNDVGIIKLSTQANPSNPICLVNVTPPANAEQNVTTMGWGTFDCRRFSDSLRKADGKIIPTQPCQAMRSEPVSANSLCAHFFTSNSNYRAPHKGDSGAPLITMGTGGVDKQIGLFSYGSDNLNGCPIASNPGVFTFPFSAASFINQHAQPTYCA